MAAVPAVPARDYRLTGAESERAVERGLAAAGWFQPTVEPSVLRGLQVRSDGRAARDVVLWLALLAGAGVWAWWSLWSWWSVPAFAVYGALYGGAADARWHECGHGTAFRSARANDAVYHLASFMLLRGPTVWRWSHYRHHTDTLIVGRDAEIAFQRPANVWKAAFAFTHLVTGPKMLWRLVRHAVGRVDADAREVVPESELGRVRWESRVFVVGVAGAAAWSVATWSIVPLMFVGLPSIYGAWLVVFFGITQHAGMREDVLDHRLNTRSVRMNPVFRFLYLNMNYHVEHHLFPSVPYPALPRLHAEVGSQLAPITPSTLAAYRGIWTTLWRQQHDPSYEIPLSVPATVTSPAPLAVGVDHPAAGVGGSVDLGAGHLLATGELRRVDVTIDGTERTFALGRLDNGDVILADGLCTHQQVHLCEGTLVEGAIECPKHNGRFDARTGQPVRRPAREPLTTYDVDEAGGRITTRLRARRLDTSPRRPAGEPRQEPQD